MATDKAAGRVLLPTHTEPLHYDLTLDVDLDKFTFDGKEVVTVDVKESTTSVVLHSKEIAVSSVSFVSDVEGSSAVSPTGINFDLKATTLTFVFAEPLTVGQGKLTIDFVGQLNNQMAGFYRSQYTDVSGASKFMASTQFEALDARRCFPCWDEPALKAVFKCTLIVPTNLTAFSNMPETAVRLLPGGRKSIDFMETPRMSTYLLAFCVGEFDFVQAKTEHGVLVRVYTPPGKAEQGTFSLGCATRTLDFYDDFFQIPYPLPKLDMVAIPEFAMGAMENWGLVTYREVDVLIDNAKASSQQKQRVCTVVTHELAHQWFGNLVTMRWWDDLWLNEGFASWTQTFAADFLFPEWQMWEQFVTDDQAAALRLDALRTSHPIQVPIAHAEEVEQVFDAISYCKGACVVRMIHAVLGPEAFQKGLQNYMQKYKYTNTETTDLWQAWQDASGKPIQQVMASWTEQMGFPLLTVTSESWDAAGVTLEVEQSWFLADGSAVKPEEEKTWTVPVIVGGSSTSAQPVDLQSDKKFKVTIPLSDAGESAWVKLNFGQHVPQRVAYTPALWQRLIPAIKSKALAAEDRAGLILDAYALTQAGKMDPAALIRLLAAYENEDNGTVWDSLAQVIGGLYKVLIQNKEVFGNFLAFVSKLLSKVAAQVGWEPKETDGHGTKLLRGTIISMLGKYSEGDAAVNAEARKRFDAIMADPKDPSACPAEYKVAVLKIVLRAGGDAEYEQVLSLFDKYEDNAEKKHVMHALGAAPSLALKRRTLDWATSGAVKLQDFFYPILSVSSSSKEGLTLAWQYFQDNFDRYETMLASASPSLFSAVIIYSCGSFASAEKAEEIEAFFKTHPRPTNERRISQMLESIRNNGALAEKFLASEAGKQELWASLL